MSVGTLEIREHVVPRLDDGDPIFPDIDESNGRRRGCLWDDSVCTESPTHHLTWWANQEETETETEVFCARHYATTLARWATMHNKTAHCTVPLKDHLVEYGEIGG
jgi:hypothetical protein